MDNRPIGMFDSGIGGLTVLKEYINLFPNEDFIYYADTANLPYGDKSKEQILKIAKEIVEYFISKNVKAIVIACGTVSALAYPILASEYDIPIFNIIEPVAKNIKEKDIGIIATQGSVNSKVWENEIKKYNPMTNTIAVACPKLVPLAECGKADSIEAQKALKEYLSIFKTNKIDSLILGCTHYPLFSGLIQKELGTDVNLINVGTYSAEEFKKFLIETNLSNSDNNLGQAAYIASGNIPINTKVNWIKK